MDRLTSEQARRNAQTRAAWADYAPHRRIVTELLLRGRLPHRERLCVMGAGNTNDLDLALLAPVFREIHLVDLDAAALAEGVARQGMTSASSITCHAPIELTGVVDRLATWDLQHAPSVEAVSDCIRAAREYAGPCVPGPFDVVGSTCLLTQLLDLVANSLPASHPHFIELLLAVRDRHLRLICEWLAPGGLALLVTDVVSTDTCPDLATVPSAELAPFVAAQIAERNFFTGANPQAIAAFFERDEQWRASIERIAFAGPWRWQVGPRTFAVCAVEIHRRPSA